jgi:sulfur relay (sulfurtransferase) DsrF/TusC family protein
VSVKPRKVILGLHRLPSGGSNLAGVLRLAVGMASAYTYHQVQVILYGEGVLCGLRQANSPWVNRYLKSASAHKIPLFADRESLASRGFGPEDLADAVSLIEPADYLEKWRQAEIHIRM